MIYPIYALPLQNKPLQEPFSIKMTANKEFIIYINGKLIGSGIGPNITYNFDTFVEKGDVVAIQGRNE